MKKISIYLKDSLEKQLKKEAEKEEVSLSEYSKQLIELGLKIRSIQRDETREKKEELMDKTPEYLIRLLNICSEMFRCIYDQDKVARPADTPNDALDSIKNTTIAYLDGFLEKR